MPMDNAKDKGRGNSDFGRKANVVAFSETVDLTTYAKVRCNAAGKLAFTPAGQPLDDSTGKVVIDVVAGEVIPWRVRRVWATGTTVAAGSVLTIE